MGISRQLYISSFQHYEETAVTRSLVYLLKLYQQYRLRIKAYKLTTRCIGTTSSAITRVLLMRTGYKATDEWVRPASWSSGQSF